MSIVSQLTRRTLSGSSIQMHTATCDRCPPLSNATIMTYIATREQYRYLRCTEYKLQICSHVFWEWEGYFNLMWDLLCEWDDNVTRCAIYKMRYYIVF